MYSYRIMSLQDWWLPDIEISQIQTWKGHHSELWVEERGGGNQSIDLFTHTVSDMTA